MRETLFTQRLTEIFTAKWTRDFSLKKKETGNDFCFLVLEFPLISET